MKEFTLISEVREELDKALKNGKTIGFVPTMGALHKGHLELIGRSVRENDITVCSIFVNPIQFNNPEDLEKYPRNLKQDGKMLLSHGCDILFAPSVAEIYPPEEKEDLKIDFGTLEQILEGKFRPGHFRGVAIVVKKLLDIVKPDRAYFGKKDYQQLMIISELVSRLQIPVKIVACETVREPDGLAMSSRNMRLTIGERKVAAKIFEALKQVKERSATQSIGVIKKWAIKHLQENPAFRVEYLEIVDKRTLLPLTKWNNRQNALACTAVWLGNVRLIDNLELF
ncbi:MAG: pantoate--beta-alanine ligase [Bacteroidetes bacterium]|nr:pantoate--beta-alanine ligase [Bacteroidota bacterium]